jgi:ribosomal protein S12 methylthiotransferase
VPEEVKADRLERFMEVQAGISAQRLQQKIGRTLPVLVDGRDANGTVIARSSADAPEIDGVVYVQGAPGLQPGDMAEVRITGASEHDLFGRLKDEG